MRFDYDDLTWITSLSTESYDTVSELIVYKTENGQFVYLQSAYCTCCGPDRQGQEVEPIELGSFIRTVRKWARDHSEGSESKRQELLADAQRMINKVIDYLDGDLEEQIETAAQKIKFHRDKLRLLATKRGQIIAEMDKMISSVTNDLNAAQIEYNKLVD